ncbi:MAG TPA: hypothetical protein VIQ05_06295 [Tardiphaga sp.]
MKERDDNLQDSLDFLDAIANWHMQCGEDRYLGSDFLSAAKHYQIAANILARQNRCLSSPRLENGLRRLAGSIRPADMPVSDNVLHGQDRNVCLHVMSECLPAGGISAMVKRWMALDRDSVHCLAVLDDTNSIPDEIERLVQDSGGKLFVADRRFDVLERAAWIRSIAGLAAGFVVLHANPTDIVYTIAFGLNGGSPVLLVNYTAHLFWVGVSIADLVLNLRGSVAENDWAVTYRRIANFSTLPIPLIAEVPNAGRSNCRTSLGVPEDAVCLLTIGASFKYISNGGADFLTTMEGILAANPNAFLLVAGFNGDANWEAASERVDGRIRMYGVVDHQKIAVLHRASDIYVEGFPFGTTTALLEAGLQGLPLMLPPKECPPPYASDGVGLDTLSAADDLESYKMLLTALISSETQRARSGEAVQIAIAEHHTGAGWLKHLNFALEKVRNRQHTLSHFDSPERTPKQIHEHWSRLVARVNYDYDLACETSLLDALSIGLAPRIDSRLLTVLGQRKHPIVPASVLSIFFNRVSPTLPMGTFKFLYRILLFCFRPNLLRRLRERLSGKARTVGMYDEYRQKKSA